MFKNDELTINISNWYSCTLIIFVYKCSENINIHMRVWKAMYVCVCVCVTTLRVYAPIKQQQQQWFFFLFSFLVFFFLVFNGQFCDVTKVTSIPKKKKEKLKKGPNSPTSPTTKVLFLKKKDKGVLPQYWLPNRTYHKSLVFQKFFFSPQSLANLGPFISHEKSFKQVEI